jgi:HJR/Mrr/RecB family endonuclease
MDTMTEVNRLVAEPLNRIDPTQFEYFIGALLGRLGWQYEVTPQSGDEGVDVIATREADDLPPWTVFVQVRRITRDSFGASDVTDCVRKIQRHYDTEEFDRIVIATTAEATAQARITEAKYGRASVWDRDILVERVLEARAFDLILDHLGAETR